MNRKTVQVSLYGLAGDDSSPFGNAKGKEVFQRLKEFVEAHPEADVFAISLDGIVATDASFPRESVLTLAKQLRAEKGFYLEKVSNRDLIDNWNYAATAKEQPIVIWEADKFEVLGPQLGAAAREMVEYVLRSGPVFASKVAADLHISVPNASTRLKHLWISGYILRVGETAETGGKEYRYIPIR
jgi:hypothetical protein